jgi:hypothetical protein
MLKHYAINGWKTQYGVGGIAVRKACELILQNPGIPQQELFDRAVKFSGLNRSTATWIVSPKHARSPAGKLWERRKDGVFRCYPNNFTGLFVGAIEARKSDLEDFILKARHEYTDRSLKTGDLVNVNHADFMEIPPKQGILVGWVCPQSPHRYHRSSDQDPIIGTFFDAVDAVINGEYFTNIWPMILENGMTTPEVCYDAESVSRVVE